MASPADPEPTSANPPVLPPGFRTEVGFDFGHTLRPKGFFLAVVRMMAEMTRAPWDTVHQNGAIMKLSGVEVIVMPTTQSSLRVSHAALGLNAAANAAVQEALFYRCLTNISSHGLEIGKIEIDRSEFGSVDNQATNYGPERKLTTKNLGEMGTFADPKDNKFEIAYDFDGRKISSKDMFTAVVDALTTIRQFDQNARFETLHAVGPLSRTGQAVIFIREVSSRRGLTNYDVKRALLLIFDYNVVQNKFGEMGFDFFWDGEKIATGYVLRLDPPFTGGGATA